MSATLVYEPYKVPAGLLALAVHLLFFALLYVGFSWQSVTPQSISVDLWQDLPEPVAPPLPPPEPTPEAKPVPPEPVVETVKPDIAIPDRKKKPPAAKPVPQDENKPLPKIVVDTAPVQPAQPVPDPQVMEAERAQQEKAAASKRVVDEYVGRIVARIRGNIVERPGIDKRLRAEFMVTLLPGGTVLNVKRYKPSGDAQYDDAVERAIYKSQPLPLPPDVALFKNFRELKLGFEPEK
jgi:colicin import membrane protein